jgi:hypothetical protein
VTRDITKLAGPAKGTWYHAYVIIDNFSRYIVGHTVERAEPEVSPGTRQTGKRSRVWSGSVKRAA